MKQSDEAGVIVTDICLPGISGMDLLTTLVQRDPNLPVIMITGHGDISMAVNALHQGAYDFIEKPFAPEHLVETVKRAIERRQLTNENEKLRQSLKASQTLGPESLVKPLASKRYEKPSPTLLILMPIFCCLAKQVQVKSLSPAHCTNKVLVETITLWR